MPANMRIDQAGLPAGIPGRARTDGLADGSVVTVTNLGGGTAVVRLLWVPPEDTTAVSSLMESAPGVWTFVPSLDAYGSYRIELIVDQGLPTESRQIRIFGVRTTEGLLIPAANESADSSASLENDTVSTIDRSENNEAFGPFASGSSFGWWRALRDTIMAVSSGGGGGLTLAQVIAQLGGRGAAFFHQFMWGDSPVALANTVEASMVVVQGIYDPEVPPPRLTVEQPPIGQSRTFLLTLNLANPMDMSLVLDFLGTNVFVNNSEDNTYSISDPAIYQISGVSFDVGGGIGTLWRVFPITAMSIEEIAGSLAGRTTAQYMEISYNEISQIQDNAGVAWIDGGGYVDGGTPPIVNVNRPGEPGGREILAYVGFSSLVPYRLTFHFEDAVVYGTDGADSFDVLDPGLYRLSALTDGGVTSWRVSNVLTGDQFGGRNGAFSYELFHGGSPVSLNQSVGLATVEVSGDSEEPPSVLMLPQPQSGRVIVLDLELDSGCMLELQALGDAEFYETGGTSFILDREGPYLLYAMQGESVAASWRLRELSTLPLQEAVSRGEAGFEPDTGAPWFASATKTMDIRSSNKTIALLPDVGDALGRKHTLVVYCGPYELTLDPGSAAFAIHIAGRPSGALGAPVVLPTPIDGVAVFEIRGVLNAIGTQPAWVVVPLATYDDVRIGDPLGGAWPTYGRVQGPFQGGGCTDYLDNNIRSSSPLPAITSDGGQVGNGGNYPGRPGIATLATGSSSNAVAILGGHNSAIVPGEGEIRYRIDENLPNASDGTDSFVHRCGIFDNHFASADPSHGAYFDYDHTVSPNYLFITVAGGTPEVTNTGVAAVGPIFNALEIIINAAGDEVRAAINGVVVATHTTVPTAAIGPGVNLIKTLGVGYRSLEVDLQGCRTMQTVAR